MKEIEFNLLTEPWIRVRLRDNTVREVSLTEALVSAQDYADLAGEMPTQNAAVLRLLLAVLFTVFSFIQAQGENLYETLMLNLTLLRDGRECWGESKPCWELEAPKSAERTEICCPDNPAQLLTLQSRRLLLHRTGENVDGFCLLGGDFFPLDFLQPVFSFQR